MTAILPPEEWRGRSIYTLEMLMFLREQVHQGVMLEIFIGQVDVMALHSMILGIRFGQFCNRIDDKDYKEFVEWLRDVKKEFPSGGGWAGKCLDECHGDHRAAIEKFLGFVAEFVELKKRERQAGDMKPG
jgi:hypothetical protein